jgi:hypothetical protein
MVGLTGWIATCLCFSAVSVACKVQSGLANAPALGGSTIVDPRVHDVIANGPDSCGRLDLGSQRNRIPPCPASDEPHPQASSSSKLRGAHEVAARRREHSNAVCRAGGSDIVAPSPSRGTVGCDVR